MTSTSMIGENEIEKLFPKCRPKRPFNSSNSSQQLRQQDSLTNDEDDDIEGIIFSHLSMSKSTPSISTITTRGTRATFHISETTNTLTTRDNNPLSNRSQRTSFTTRMVNEGRVTNLTGDPGGKVEGGDQSGSVVRPTFPSGQEISSSSAFHPFENHVRDGSSLRTRVEVGGGSRRIFHPQSSQQVELLLHSQLPPNTHHPQQGQQFNELNSSQPPSNPSIVQTRPHHAQARHGHHPPPHHHKYHRQVWSRHHSHKSYHQHYPHHRPLPHQLAVRNFPTSSFSSSDDADDDDDEEYEGEVDEVDDYTPEEEDEEDDGVNVLQHQHPRTKSEEPSQQEPHSQANGDEDIQPTSSLSARMTKVNHNKTTTYANNLREAGVTEKSCATGTSNSQQLRDELTVDITHSRSHHNQMNVCQDPQPPPLNAWQSSMSSSLLLAVTGNNSSLDPEGKHFADQVMSTVDAACHPPASRTTSYNSEQMIQGEGEILLSNHLRNHQQPNHQVLERNISSPSTTWTNPPISPPRFITSSSVVNCHPPGRGRRSYYPSMSAPTSPGVGASSSLSSFTTSGVESRKVTACREVEGRPEGKLDEDPTSSSQIVGRGTSVGDEGGGRRFYQETQGKPPITSVTTTSASTITNHSRIPDRRDYEVDGDEGQVIARVIGNIPIPLYEGSPRKYGHHHLHHPPNNQPRGQPQQMNKMLSTSRIFNSLLRDGSDEFNVSENGTIEHDMESLPLLDPSTPTTSPHLDREDEVLILSTRRASNNSILSSSSKNTRDEGSSQASQNTVMTMMVMGSPPTSPPAFGVAGSFDRSVFSSTENMDDSGYHPSQRHNSFRQSDMNVRTWEMPSLSTSVSNNLNNVASSGLSPSSSTLSSSSPSSTLVTTSSCLNNSNGNHLHSLNNNNITQCVTSSSTYGKGSLLNMDGHPHPHHHNVINDSQSSHHPSMHTNSSNQQTALYNSHPLSHPPPHARINQHNSSTNNFIQHVSHQSTSSSSGQTQHLYPTSTSKSIEQQQQQFVSPEHSDSSKSASCVGNSSNLPPAAIVGYTSSPHPHSSSSSSSTIVAGTSTLPPPVIPEEQQESTQIMPTVSHHPSISSPSQPPSNHNHSAASSTSSSSGKRDGGGGKGDREQRDKASSSSHHSSSSKNNNNTSREVLIEGVLFRARYLGSTQLVCEGQPTKATRMLQAEEAVSRIKSLAPEGETQPSTEVDLFISTEKIMVLNTDLKEIMMDHSLRSISYIADIGDLLVLMARRRIVNSDSDHSTSSNSTSQKDLIKRMPKMICHVFESEEAQFIAQSIGQAFQVAYMEFLKANGIEDSSFVKEMDYQEVLNSQEIFGDELEMFAKKDKQKEVIVPKQKGEILGVVIVESGWGSMLPTVVIANMAHGSPASRCGHLNIGDQIIAINGVSLVGLNLSTCQNYIKNTKTQTAIKLTVVPCPPVVEVKIKRPDTKYQLGFSVQNGVICSLLRGGIAERGGVRVGHRIIEINGQSVVAVPHERIVNLLATSVGEISMKTMPTSMFRLLTGQETPTFI